MSTRRILSVLLVLFFSMFPIFALPTFLKAAPSDLDPTFGEEGIVKTAIGEADEYGQAAVRQPDGRIVVAGYAYQDFALARYNTDGSLDAAFGRQGKVTADLSGSYDIGYGVALQEDGKILVTGESTPGDYSDLRFALTRYNVDGSLDVTFDGDGWAVTDFGDYQAFARAVAVQPDGKIVVAGYTGGSIAVARCSSDGSLDPSFDGDGKVTTRIDGHSSEGWAVAVQNDGKIVVAGCTYTGSYSFSLVRYNADGSLDTTFGSNGNVEVFNGKAYALAIQADGKILAVGYASVSGSDDFALARFSPDGSLDTAFSYDGMVTTDFVGATDVGRAVVLQSDGKIVVSGYARDGDSDRFALARYNSDGSYDTTLDGDGKAIASFGGHSDGAHAVLMQSNGRIVAAGYAYTSSRDFALVGYLPDGQLDTAFGDAGRVSTDFDLGYSEARGIAIRSDGRIVVAGTVNSGNMGFALARYHPDGSLDTSLGGGYLTTEFPGAYAMGRDLALQPDGKTVVVGSAQKYDGSGDFALARYHPDGSLDSGFGEGGLVTTDFVGGWDGATAVAVQRDGRIIVAGRAGIDDSSEFGLARYNSDGSLDTSFGTDGKVTTDVGIYVDQANDMILQADGKILVAGSAGGDGGTDFGLARYNPDGSLDTNFGVAGKVITDFPSSWSSESVAYGLALQEDGRIIIVGDVLTGSHDLAMACYNTDGSLDTTFGDGGKVITDVSGSADYGKAVVTQVDAKIVIVGYGVAISSGRYAWVSARYNADGSLDAHFGTGGKLVTELAMGADGFAYAAALQPDGKIVVGGASGTFALARYQGDPPLDVSIEAENDTVILSWEMANSGESCEVWRDTTPCLSPHEGSSELIHTITPCGPGTIEFRDPEQIGDPTVNHFYRVRTLDAAAQPVVTSNRVGEFDFALLQ